MAEHWTACSLSRASDIRIYAPDPSSRAVVETEDVVVPNVMWSDEHRNIAKELRSLHVVASRIRYELEDLAELQGVRAVVDLGSRDISTRRSHPAG